VAVSTGLVDPFNRIALRKNTSVRDRLLTLFPLWNSRSKQTENRLFAELAKIVGRNKFTKNEQYLENTGGKR